MKYFWDGKQASRDDVKRYLSEELECAEKDTRHFQGRIFYNLDYLEHSAKQDMAITGESHWSNFSLLIEI